MNTMLIDCVGCAARGPACDDCVVSALLGAPEQGAPEMAALADLWLLPAREGMWQMPQTKVLAGS